jgi:hypothetical protein
LSNNITSQAKRHRARLEKATKSPTFALSFEVDRTGETPKPGKMAFSFEAINFPEIIEGRNVTPLGMKMLISALCTAIDQIANFSQGGELAERLRNTIADFGNEQTKAA